MSPLAYRERVPGAGNAVRSECDDTGSVAYIEMVSTHASRFVDNYLPQVVGLRFGAVIMPRALGMPRRRRSRSFQLQRMEHRYNCRTGPAARSGLEAASLCKDRQNFYLLGVGSARWPRVRKRCVLRTFWATLHVVLPCCQYGSRCQHPRGRRTAPVEFLACGQQGTRLASNMRIS